MRTCEKPGCNRKHFGRGMCQACYMKEWRKEHPEYTIPGLRESLKHLKEEHAKELAYAVESARQEVSDFVDEFLGQFDGSCRYDGQVAIRLGEKHRTSKL